VIEEQNPDSNTLLCKGFLRSFARWLVVGAVLVWSLAALLLPGARWIDPLSTAVHPSVEAISRFLLYPPDGQTVNRREKLQSERSGRMLWASRPFERPEHT
jgi:hypothetical protein